MSLHCLSRCLSCLPSLVSFNISNRLEKERCPPSGRSPFSIISTASGYFFPQRDLTDLSSCLIEAALRNVMCFVPQRYPVRWEGTCNDARVYGCTSATMETDISDLSKYGASNKARVGGSEAAFPSNIRLSLRYSVGMLVSLVPTYSYVHSTCPHG